MLFMVGWACAVLVSVTGQTIIHINPLYTSYSDGLESRYGEIYFVGTHRSQPNKNQVIVL